MSNKVLVCIINELRAHELTWESFKTNVIDTLQADLAVCIAISKKDNFDNNNFYKYAKYKWTYPEQEDWGNSFDYVKSFYNTKKNWELLLQIEGIWLGGMKRKGAMRGSASIGYFFRWFLLQNLINNNLINNYDYFIITRCDYKWILPHPPIEYLNKEFIWIPNGDHYGGFNDRYICVSKEYIKIVLNLLEEIILRPNNLLNVIKQYNFCGLNSEKFQKIYLDMYNLYPKIRTFPYIMYLIKGFNDSSRWSNGVLEIDNYLVKYKSEYDNSLKSKSLIQNWDEYFSSNPINTITNNNIIKKLNTNNKKQKTKPVSKPKFALQKPKVAPVFKKTTITITPSKPKKKIIPIKNILKKYVIKHTK